MIEIHNLRKYFGSVKAVDGIDLSVNEGEIFGFLGPNGAGKTTTIFLLMDFLKPSSGTATINGMDVNVYASELKKAVGYISADVHFYENMTARAHFDLINGLRGRSSNLTELLDDFDLNPNKKPSELSTGNRQKLAIIMALMHDTKVLIMDEPTRGLDPLYQNVFYKWLRKLNQQGTTIFMSSHNLAEIEAICGRVAIIKSGFLVAVEEIKSLQIKRMHLAEVEFSSKVKRELFEKKDYHIEEFTGEHLKLKIAGEINEFLKDLAGLPVKDLQIMHVSLEEIFMEYYKD